MVLPFRPTEQKFHELLGFCNKLIFFSNLRNQITLHLRKRESLKLMLKCSGKPKEEKIKIDTTQSHVYRNYGIMYNYRSIFSARIPGKSKRELIVERINRNRAIATSSRSDARLSF